MYESQFEERLYNERREKLRQIAELGQKQGLNALEATYPNHFDATHTVEQILPLGKKADGADKTAEELAAENIDVSVAGRVMAIRVQGKAGFAQIQQGGQRIQIYVRKDDVGEDAFALYKLLDLGDHIGVKGFLMRTRTGELTVHVEELTFLAKAMLALPDKFHGLEDTELRYRQRYLDLFVNPEVREVFVKRAAVLRAMRRFFDERGYLEVETPMMHTIAGGAAARPFVTHHNALDIDLKLRIAPELYLKRLVVGGLDRVYEINRNFRNEGISTQHNPEFTMVEFYQAYSNYHDLMDLTMELVAYVANEVNGTTKTTFNGTEIDLVPEKWQKLSMREAIIKFWPAERFDNLPIAGDPPSMEDFATYEAFDRMIERAFASIRNFQNMPSSVFNKVIYQFEQVLYQGGENLGRSIAALFEQLAEEHLLQPTIIYDFPLAVSPLSKVKPDEPDWVERFEFYIGGFEVGNAFSELNDPDDQRRRFEDQLKERDRGDDEAHHMDEDYVRALGYGLPPTAGEGIGIDRLTMVLTGSKSIRDVILFPLMRPLGKSEREAAGEAE